ncbi:uncharacterized protein isoform X2 [Rhodnius prolixus]|uniref:uncharacterized protein isoform X2 n=1 Tax=Rhodnius prolixus TaxID=13249 RepID=UPI003D18D490
MCIIYLFQEIHKTGAVGRTVQKGKKKKKNYRLYQDLMEMVTDRYNRENRNLCQQQDRARSAGRLLVTYSLNNGVEIIGKPVEPPPYSQQAALPPSDQGPPPPYLPTSTTEEDVR